jgi:hypothetical protein
MNHEFYVETDDIEEVLRNYQFPDFCDCESIVGEAEYIMGGNTWTEMSETELEMLI